MAKNKFPFFRQLDNKDCGPTCLRMIAKFYGKTFSREFLRDKAGITRTGVNMAGKSEGAATLEKRPLGRRTFKGRFVKETPTSFIRPWRKKHFVDFYKN